MQRRRGQTALRSPLCAGWREWDRATRSMMDGVHIIRFDGFVAQYLGDGVLAYFGYPQAHEDEAERAG